MSVTINYSKVDKSYSLNIKMFENGYTTSQPLNKEIFEQLIALFKNEGKIQKILGNMEKKMKDCNDCFYNDLENDEYENCKYCEDKNNHFVNEMKTRKIVINACYGGYSLSSKALDRIDSCQYEISRDDPELVKIVEELGEGSWGSCAELAIVEIPFDVDWEINDYDGMEHIAEVHRTWS